MMALPMNYNLIFGAGVAITAMFVVHYYFLNRRKQEEKVGIDAGQGPEKVVAHESQLAPGEMLEVAVPDTDGGKVLLCRHQNGEISAIGHKCPHYGAPLAKGVFSNGRVRCPWHGACFSAHSGDIEDFPTQDAVHSFPVRVDAGSGDVLVRAAPEALRNFRRQPQFKACGEKDGRLFCIVGAGPAGLSAAETLRESGFNGRIMLIGAEPHLPYDRTKLSKAMSSPADKIALRPAEFFKQARIALKLSTRVADFDPASRTLTLEPAGAPSGAAARQRETVEADGVLLCTGGTPRSLPMPGMELERVWQLRIPEEAHAIVARAKGARVAIIGSSFIGMEAAAALVKQAKSVDVIGMEKVPFERVLGHDVGAALQRLHEAKGVQFHMERTVARVEDDGKGGVGGVILDNGHHLEADMCVVGAGVIPATKFVRATGGLELARDGSVLCDANMQSGAPGVFAAGDIARHPYDRWIQRGEPADQSLVRIEHIGFAQYQGQLAALNMMGRPKRNTGVPFFWTAMYGKSLRYAGHALRYDEVLIDGSLDQLNFAAYYLNGKHCDAVVTLGRDPLASAAAELMHFGKMPAASVIRRNPAIDLVAVLKKAMKSIPK